MNHAVAFRKTVFPNSVLMEAEAFKRKISTRLYKLRMARKDLISTVARAVGISDEMLEKIESGTYNFTVDILLRLCEYYKVDPDKVVCGR
mgnify:CR=1 FL=1|jgi:transcriptional regulator with XRE-family HTH domain